MGLEPILPIDWPDAMDAMPNFDGYCDCDGPCTCKRTLMGGIFELFTHTSITGAT